MVASRSFHPLILLLPGLLALMVAPLRAAEAEQLEKLFIEANAKTDAGDHQAAIEIYNHILETNPEADNVWITRAIAKWRLKDASGAFADLAQAINVNPENFEAYNRRARFRYDRQEYQRSLADFNRAIELMETLLGELKWGSAQADRDQATYLATQLPDLFRFRGQAQANLGDRAAALQDLNRAIELRPDFAAALLLRARIRDEAQEFESAFADYSQVTKLAPKNPDGWRNRGWLQLLRHEWSAAIADTEKALAITPQDARAIRTLGYAQFAKGDYAAAAATLAKAADVEPGLDSAYALFVRHYALARTTGADARLAKTWESWKDAAWVQALAKFITGEISEEELEKIAQSAPDDGELRARACEMHFYIGLARVQAGDKSTARLRFKSTLGTDQKDFVENALASAELKRL